MKEKRPRWKAQPSDVAVAQRGHTLHAEQLMSFTSGSQLGPACQGSQISKREEQHLGYRSEEVLVPERERLLPPKVKVLGVVVHL